MPAPEAHANPDSVEVAVAADALLCGVEVGLVAVGEVELDGDAVAFTWAAGDGLLVAAGDGAEDDTVKVASRRTTVVDVVTVALNV